ncbi:haloalkanoic acid dehalogenase [Paecilomyces variotii No. 5]|uniref:Haloalkanoic acid dehalogenase n=1 Tax=Byssochlamys spectabilis (strain No. 5 / NBRC 109023) TaxID=1356009 RepID=V5G399_BYSSN|nr:haloalkanoic acid dehalogenase [Paecilomyces variotii No. 5]
MSKLSDYRLLSFDVYGTLVNWEAGILSALEPALSKANAKYTPEQILTVYQALESSQQTITPDMPYSQLLATIYPLLAQNLKLPIATEEDCRRFGDSVGHWPAFSDTVDALRRLSKHYKLVVLSNVDRDSFAKTNAGSLQNFPFDMIITAQDIGSYKPNLRNFEYMLEAVKKEFGIERDQVLQTAQSQFHDHHPAKKVGLKTAWIVRPGAIMGNLGEEIYDWKFNTLGEMADALEKETK